MTNEGFWWLSFADGGRPKGQQFLGGAIVRADGMLDAVRRAHVLGINPGGEVQGHKIVRMAGTGPIPDQYVERLLSRKDIDAMDTVLMKHATN